MNQRLAVNGLAVHGLAGHGLAGHGLAGHGLGKAFPARVRATVPGAG
jgi:hypothetical protein